MIAEEQTHTTTQENMDLQSIKNRFGIIGNSPALNHALNTAVQVAATDLTVLIVGESGVGKEAFSQIIHSLSSRKHNPFIAVNCGAIPEGTIDSELFGHEKGAFTGAVDSRKGYFETVNGGTIFMDEIGEMPLGTQARLLRVLETGEFIRVGSSKVQKTDVRVIAATNRELLEFTQKGRFREDLYYRLSTVPIRVPSLRDRKEDIQLLFRKFVVDFAERYKTTSVQLDDEAKNLLINYHWPGNVRELKNIAEQISVLSPNPTIAGAEMRRFLPEKTGNRLPVLAGHPNTGEFANEREILYKLFFDMKKDVTELKKMFLDILQNPSLVNSAANYTRDSLVNDFHGSAESAPMISSQVMPQPANAQPSFLSPGSSNGQPVLLHDDDIHHHEEVEESLNIVDKEKELIVKALKKHKGKRRDASLDLGISERTLYRKLKEYDIDE
jgi:transcriptional regulator with PAS, ATPase and Fis domain